METQSQPMYLFSTRQQPKLSRLSAPQDLEHISRVEYAHDPVPKAPAYLAIVDYPFTRKSLVVCHNQHGNAVRLQPRASYLPYRCSLDATWENRFWRSGLESSSKLLRLLAADRSTTDIVLGNGMTMARLARRELQPGFEHRFCKATSYMYPFCDEERMKLLASTMVMMFLFDGMIFQIGYQESHS